MKKNILYFASLLFGVTMFTACSPDDGTEPGNDDSAVATIYSYSDPGDGYSADNDVHYRVATNSKASEVKYLAELTSTKEARNMTDTQYADYILQNGTTVEVGANSYKDVYITDLHGEYTVSFVPVGGNGSSLRSFEFAGLDFQPWGTGTYSYGAFGGSEEVTILHSEIGDRYRAVNVWAEGYNLDFTISGSTATMIPSGPFEIGWSNSRYGAYMYTDAGSVYDASSSTVTFNFTLTVSAGSFGDYTDVLVLHKN